MDPSVLKDIILNVKQPLVLANLKIPWCCFRDEKSFEEWLQPMDCQKPAGFHFDSGSLRHGSLPQWERNRNKVMMSMTHFLRNASTRTGHFENNWASYSYRYIEELPAACRKNVDFSSFGFPEVSEDISFWLGSTGAHTPCHYDTYGCNIVVQVHGRKSWLLFPPEAPLTKMRVPYEESSVYCEENFYSPPGYSQFLEPGMALVVPPKWWHYVENLECSLNFNTWIPLVSDIDERLSECLTRIIVHSYISEKDDKILKHVYNPNELPVSAELSTANLNLTLEYLLNQRACNKRQHKDHQYNTNYLTQPDLDGLIASHSSYIKPVRRLKNYEFFHLIKQNQQRFDEHFEELDPDEEEKSRITKVINQCCHPEVIDLVKQYLE
ncbi:HSPB1-associated protein 1 isoform X2 [Uranotaenia lowii]|uniref:HSPB1-associated protein 1 isoform X2 n=1 Tax=Uranotaenia lowii TaxID=190385 RepID=UPI002479710B|nr:HSPB1-associated protein 1 isoform X2 [Uranotaenia lowii]